MHLLHLTVIPLDSARPMPPCLPKYSQHLQFICPSLSILAASGSAAGHMLGADPVRRNETPSTSDFTTQQLPNSVSWTESVYLPPKC